MVCFTRVGRFDQDFLKAFIKAKQTVVLIMRMKRRRPFVSLTKMEMVLVALRLTYMVSLLFFLVQSLRISD